jgi:RNA polymerase subunit RPABC4/transcription elongation factor Spt4
VRKPSNILSFVRITPISFHRNKDKDLTISDLNKGLQDAEPGCVALPSYDGSHKGSEPSVTANSTDDLDGSLQDTFPRPQAEGANNSEVEDTERGEDSQRKYAMHVNLDKPLSELKCTSSPNDVVVINIKPTHSAFVAVPRATRPGLAPPVFPSSSSLRNNVLSEPRKAGNVQLFAFKYISEEVEESAARPKRKLKCTVRFDPEMTDTHANVCKTGHGFTCPRCKYVCEYDSKLCTGCQLECYYEAGVGVVVLKERASLVADHTTIPMEKKPNASLSAHARPESVLCNCTCCGRHHLSIQGIYAHHGRSHQLHGKLDWSKVTFSCPLCKSSQVFTLEEAERHVREHHPGSELVTPNTLQPYRNKSRSKAADLPPHSSLHPNKLRITRTKKRPYERNTASDVNSHKVTPKWTTLDYRSLLPHCKKDYPRDICNILDLVDDQCKAQEEWTETACEQRLKLCRTEAEIEAKAWEDDRLAYQRGIRERSRYADGERIEKQKFVESSKLRLMQYEYENRSRKRSRNEVEAEKLCSKPVVFASGRGRNLPQERVLCNDEQCELCKNDSNYLQSVMLDAEMASFRKEKTSSQSLHPAVNLLNPSFREITDNYFAEAEHCFENKAKVAKSIGGKHEGNRKANNSRRDIVTSKRLRTEEDKLFKMKRTQQSLLFVKKYNEGLITCAWNENKNEKRR